MSDIAPEHGRIQVPDEDQVLVDRVLKILYAVARLTPHLSRLKVIAENADHPLFAHPDLTISPEMKEHMRLMRKAQLGALVNVISIMQKTSLKTVAEAPKIERQAQKSAVDKAMEGLGIDV